MRGWWRAAGALLSASLALALGPARLECQPLDVAALISGHAEELGPIARDPEIYRLQILVARVVEPPRAGAPARLERSGFRVDAEYFYPASAVKLAGVVVAIEWLHGIDQWVGHVPTAPPIGVATPLRFHALEPGGPVVDQDASNLDGGRITAAHLARKILLVSDNEAYNRLYDLIGQQELNERLWAWGLRTARLQHRLGETPGPRDQRRTPAVELLVPGRAPITLPERTSSLDLENRDLPGLEVGRAYYEDGELVQKPFSFRHKNRFGLRDLQELLVMVLRPELARVQLAWSDDELELVREAMEQAPRESENPRYDPEEFPDDYAELIRPGVERALAGRPVAVYNKVGWAHGFQTENAYVVDRASGKAFFVTATVYVNPDGILNDDQYAYEELGRPFFEALGELLAKTLL